MAVLIKKNKIERHIVGLGVRVSILGGEGQEPAFNLHKETAGFMGNVVLILSQQD